MTRESWTTRVGFVLAAVGSAVGLGNIWRFPWMTAENGGSAFLVLYLGIVLLVGVPGIVGEFVIGRRSNRNPVGALRSLSGSESWGVVGHLSVATAIFLLSFYSVVGGWILRYFLASFTGAYFDNPGEYFYAIDYGVQAVAFHALFLLLTAGIVYLGVRKGIELGTKVMMPAIVVMLVALAVWASGLTGAGAGYSFYLAFDLSTVRANFLDVLPAAAGQALFTLSLGAGTMITYASYLSEDRALLEDGTIIATLNTFVGVLAGFVVFPLLFSVGADPSTSGPGALFVSIAGAFQSLPAGRVVAVLFFGVVTVAALSSSISMLEIPVSFLGDEYGVPRRTAVFGMTGVFLVTGAVNALVPSVFGFVAGMLVDLLLTVGLLTFLVFVAWVVGEGAVEEFVAGGGPVSRAVAVPWRYFVGVVIPVFLTFTLLSAVLPMANVDVGVPGTLAAAVVVTLVVVGAVRRAPVGA